MRTGRNGVGSLVRLLSDAYDDDELCVGQYASIRTSGGWCVLVGGAGMCISGATHGLLDLCVAGAVLAWSVAETPVFHVQIVSTCDAIHALAYNYATLATACLTLRNSALAIVTARPLVSSPRRLDASAIATCSTTRCQSTFVALVLPLVSVAVQLTVYVAWRLSGREYDADCLAPTETGGIDLQHGSIIAFVCAIYICSDTLLTITRERAIDAMVHRPPETTTTHTRMGRRHPVVRVTGRSLLLSGTTYAFTAYMRSADGWRSAATGWSSLFHPAMFALTTVTASRVFCAVSVTFRNNEAVRRNSVQLGRHTETSVPLLDLSAGRMHQTGQFDFPIPALRVAKKMAVPIDEDEGAETKAEATADDGDATVAEAEAEAAAELCGSLRAHSYAESSTDLELSGDLSGRSAHLQMGRDRGGEAKKAAPSSAGEDEALAAAGFAHVSDPPTWSTRAAMMTRMRRSPSAGSASLDAIEYAAFAFTSPDGSPGVAFAPVVCTLHDALVTAAGMSAYTLYCARSSTARSFEFLMEMLALDASHRAGTCAVPDQVCMQVVASAWGDEAGVQSDAILALYECEIRRMLSIARRGGDFIGDWGSIRDSLYASHTLDGFDAFKAGKEYANMMRLSAPSVWTTNIVRDFRYASAKRVRSCVVGCEVVFVACPRNTPPAALGCGITNKQSTKATSHGNVSVRDVLSLSGILPSPAVCVVVRNYSKDETGDGKKSAVQSWIDAADTPTITVEAERLQFGP
jgi:hypothetical protein